MNWTSQIYTVPVWVCWRIDFKNRNTAGVKLLLHTEIRFKYFSFSLSRCVIILLCRRMFPPLQMADDWPMVRHWHTCMWDHSHTKVEIWFPITTMLLEGTTPACTHIHILDWTSVPPPVPSWVFVTEGQSPVLCGDLRKRLVSEPGAAARAWLSDSV